MSYLFAANFPLIAKFNWILLKLREGGFIELLYDPYGYQSLKKADELSPAKAFGIRDLPINFHVFLIAWIFALFIFLIEISIYKVEESDSIRKKFCRTFN